MRRREIAGIVLSAAGGLLLAGCPPKTAPPSKDGGLKVVRVYTSLYREVVEAVAPVVSAELARTAPGVAVEWVQGNSGKIARRLDDEHRSGGSTADVLLVSDVAYYHRLKAEGRLVSYFSPKAATHPSETRDADGAFATSRFSTMVIGLSPEMAAGMAGKAPARFEELDVYGTRLAMGDPAVSGTAFTTTAELSSRFGWDWFRALKAKGALAAGSNSTVLQRLDTGVSDVGVVLLENLLMAKAGGSKVGVVFPKDGAVLIPGPIALLPHAKGSPAARAVYDAILAEPTQRAIVAQGFMHSPDPALPPPSGAPTFRELLAEKPLDTLYRPREDAEQVLATFREIFQGHRGPGSSPESPKGEVKAR